MQFIAWLATNVITIKVELLKMKTAAAKQTDKRNAMHLVGWFIRLEFIIGD